MSPKYEVVIYWSKEDEAFLAEVPELPGCVADGAEMARERHVEVPLGDAH